MTPAEKALIDAALKNDCHQARGSLYALARDVAAERIDPAIKAEFKECLRAHMRATWAFNAFSERLPPIALEGTGGLIDTLWGEIEKEEGRK